jgi:Nickel responsive protein SCO4226-like
MPRLIVEHSYDPPLTDEEHRRAAKRLDPCLEAHGARWMSSYLSHDRRRMICEFDAPDAEAVRQSMRSADVAFDRVWTSEVYRRGEPDVK